MSDFDLMNCKGGHEQTWNLYNLYHNKALGFYKESVQSGCLYSDSLQNTCYNNLDTPPSTSAKPSS